MSECELAVQMKVGKLKGYHEELSNSLVQDLLPAISKWVDENYERFSSLPGLLPDAFPDDLEAAPESAQEP